MIYCDSLQHEDPSALETAFRRALNECEMMPRLCEIRARLPYLPTTSKIASSTRPQNRMKEHFEAIDDESRLHVWTTEDGKNRYVRIESIESIRAK